MTVIYEGRHYRATRVMGGILLTQLLTDDDVFFQAGDDANAFEDDVEAFIRADDQGINVPEDVYFGEYF